MIEAHFDNTDNSRLSSDPGSSSLFWIMSKDFHESQIRHPQVWALRRLCPGGFPQGTGPRIGRLNSSESESPEIRFWPAVIFAMHILCPQGKGQTSQSLTCPFPVSWVVADKSVGETHTCGIEIVPSSSTPRLASRTPTYLWCYLTRKWNVIPDLAGGAQMQRHSLPQFFFFLDLSIAISGWLGIRGRRNYWIHTSVPTVREIRRKAFDMYLRCLEIHRITAWFGIYKADWQGVRGSL